MHNINVGGIAYIELMFQGHFNKGSYKGMIFIYMFYMVNENYSYIINSLSYIYACYRQNVKIILLNVFEMILDN